MHRTESLDYIIMLQGEITLELEDGQKTVLKAGDVAIQQGTYVMASSFGYSIRRPKLMMYAQLAQMD